MESRSDLLETVAAERESVDSDTLEQGGLLSVVTAPTPKRPSSPGATTRLPC